MEFDPEAYAKNKLAQSAPQGFDPEAYAKNKLAGKTGAPVEQKPESLSYGVLPGAKDFIKNRFPFLDLSEPDPNDQTQTTAKGLIKSTVSSIPYATGAVGGFLGGGLGPLGSIGGAGLGYGAGKSIQNLIEQQAELAPPKTAGQLIREPLKAIPEGMMQEVGGQALGKGFGFLSDRFQNLTSLKAGAPEIEKAAEALGTKATPGMLNQSPVVQGMESSLYQSPSIAGGAIRDKVVPVQNALQENTAGLLKESISPEQKFSTGQNIQKGVVENLRKQYAPLKESFGRIEQESAAIPVGEKTRVRVGNNISKLSEVPGSSADQLAQRYSEQVSRTKSLSGMKEIRSDAISRLQNDQNLTSPEREVLSGVVSKIDGLFTSQARKAAVDIGGRQGREAARGFLAERKATNEGYKALKNQISELGQEGRIPGYKYGGPETFINNFEKVNAEDLPKKLFNTNDAAAMTKFQKTYPEQFELARKLRLGEIKDKITLDNGKLNINGFLNEVDKLSSEAATNLFGKDYKPKIDAIRKVHESMPRKIGASGTPEGESYKNVANVVFQGKEYANKLIYDLLSKR